MKCVTSLESYLAELSNIDSSGGRRVGKVGVGYMDLEEAIEKYST